MSDYGDRRLTPNLATVPGRSRVTKASTWTA